MPKIDRPEAARRLARAIASDVSLYNEAKIIVGIQNDSLFDVMANEIQEGRDLYHARVSDDLLTTTNFYERAIVDILVKSKGSVESDIW
ncbi:MAG: hypothetical protein C4523_10025 [Myxococcales bacterium]|nr:MAG: hypothetical protein C4523_10025 [Myxococcales bacterium]